MANAPPRKDLDQLLNEIFASTPLLFLREFLRTEKARTPRVRIGVTAKEVRANLREAVLSRAVGLDEVETWFRTVEGWGHQHLYLRLANRRSLNLKHLLSTAALTTFMESKGRLANQDAPAEPRSAHALTGILVDDELARLTWTSHTIDLERHEELDEVRELPDGEYEFRAHRHVPRRSHCRSLVRKTDGVILILIDLPLGDEHSSMLSTVEDVTSNALAPLPIQPVQLSPIVSALDQGAVARFGPRATRDLELGVAPTQARYRTDGAQVEFKSTRESAGYTDSTSVRRVRRAMQVEQFQGESGKFRLTFEGAHRQPHAMIVSLNAYDNRIFLYSRMAESEVLGLVDQLLAV